MAWPTQAECGPPMTALHLYARQLLHETRFHGLWRLLLAMLMLIVAWLAFIPGSRAPSLGIGDKIDHLMAFVALACTAALSLRAGPCQAVQAALGLLAYGSFIELVQTQLPTRTGDWADVMADSLGIAAGLLMVMLLRRLWRRPLT